MILAAYRKSDIWYA